MHVHLQSTDSRRSNRRTSGIEHAELFADLAALELNGDSRLLALGQETLVGGLLRLVVARQRDPLRFNARNLLDAALVDGQRIAQPLFLGLLECDLTLEAVDFRTHLPHTLAASRGFGRQRRLDCRLNCLRSASARRLLGDACFELGNDDVSSARHPGVRASDGAAAAPERSCAAASCWLGGSATARRLASPCRATSEPAAVAVGAAVSSSLGIVVETLEHQLAIAVAGERLHQRLDVELCALNRLHVRFELRRQASGISLPEFLELLLLCLELPARFCQLRLEEIVGRLRELPAILRVQVDEQAARAARSLSSRCRDRYT